LILPIVLALDIDGIEHSIIVVAVFGLQVGILCTLVQESEQFDEHVTIVEADEKIAPALLAQLGAKVLE
jgi:hypothetical protein